jgi:hypothetical protein
MSIDKYNLLIAKKVLSTLHHLQKTIIKDIKKEIADKKIKASTLEIYKFLNKNELTTLNKMIRRYEKMVRELEEHCSTQIRIVKIKKKKAFDSSDSFSN